MADNNGKKFPDKSIALVVKAKQRGEEGKYQNFLSGWDNPEFQTTSWNIPQNVTRELWLQIYDEMKKGKDRAIMLKSYNKKRPRNGVAAAPAWAAKSTPKAEQAVTIEEDLF